MTGADSPRSTPLQPIYPDLLPAARGYLDRARRCFADTYRRGGDVWTGEPAMQAAACILAAELATPSAVLDIGAGRGRDSRRLAGLGHRVTAVDLVDAFQPPADAETARRIQFIRGGLDAVPASAKFGGILDNGCLHHQHPDEQAAYLRLVATHLATDGLYVVSLFHRLDGEAVDHISPQGRLNLEIPELTLYELLHDAGLHTLRTAVVERADAPRAYRILAIRHAISR